VAAEKNFENKVKKFLKDQGCWVLKTWSYGTQRAGVPDLLVCCNGYFLGVELKAPTGKPSELQLWNIKEIKKAGGIALVLYPKDFEEFKTLVYNLFTK
jgi:Holliday junction resolvase